jgi:hypothetical protein
MVGIENVNRLFGAFLEIFAIRTFVVNGSGAGVEFFPRKGKLVRFLLI